jgi:hypothetical protein
MRVAPHFVLAFPQQYLIGAAQKRVNKQTRAMKSCFGTLVADCDGY